MYFQNPKREEYKIQSILFKLGLYWPCNIIELMEKAIAQLEEIKKPSNFVKAFKTIKEFSEWAEQGTKEDIIATINAFLEDGVYVECLWLILVLSKMESPENNF